MRLDGQRALFDIEKYIHERKSAKEPLLPAEKSALSIAYHDSRQSAYAQQDAALFNEFERCKQVELEYLYQVRGIRQAMPSAVFQEGYAGYGNSWTGSKIRLLYPQDRKRAGRESREPFLPINKIHETVTNGMQIVPLRINLVTDKYELHDRLVWNVDDTTIPLELFVENLLEDYGLPFTLAGDILKSLQQQISSHLPHIYPRQMVSPEPAVKSESDSDLTNTSTNAEAPTGTEVPASTEASTSTEAPPNVEASINAEVPPSAEATTSEVPIKPEVSEVSATEPRNPADSVSAPASTNTAIGSAPASQEHNTDDHSKLPAGMVDPATNKHYKYDEDMRITIKIDITIGQHQLIDQFEWDLNQPDNCPEWFAVSMAAEMSLPGEFATAIAHAIREQSQIYSRMLFNSGYQFDGKPPHVQELRNELSMPVDEHAFLRRPEALEQYTPRLQETKIASADVDSHELEQERRELRSRRRQGRSSRRYQQDARSYSTTSLATNPSLPNTAKAGPDQCTPVYSGLLPGGLDRNLSILHMVAYREDELYGGDRQDVAYYFNKNRKREQVPSASLFDESLIQREGPKWPIVLKIPRHVAQELADRESAA